MRSFTKRLSLALATLAIIGSSEAGYKRGDLLWKLDFTREDLSRVNAEKTNLVEGQNWFANAGKTGDGAMVVKNKTERETRMFGIALPVRELTGYIQVEADVRGVDLKRGPQPYNGPKIMFPYVTKGKTTYPQAPSEYGTFDWKTWYKVEYLPPETTSISLVLGLEQAPGEFAIDAVRIYRAVEVPDDEAVAPKNPPADAVPRGKWFKNGRPGARRGVMSGNDLSEAAFRTLYDWNANLIRMQIGIGYEGLATEADWFRELDRRLVEVDRVLALCRKYGLKMVVDLHGGPGCKQTKHASNVVPENYDTTALKRAWRQIATRYREDPAIYGYDILNEPACSPETWDRVFRDVTAEIRTIDRKTPVITESLHFWYPNENVIYSPHYYSPHTLTHYGVGGSQGVRWSYNNWINGEFWNKDRIREAIAPFINFQIAHPGARIYIGEFSCILWSKGAEGYVNDCVELFDEYGWDWTYHAFREWTPWSVEHEPDANYTVGKFTKAKGETARLKALKRGFAKNARWQCAYPERVRALPRLRGVMLTNEPKEKDFIDLHALGATLARYQMNPGQRLKDDATEAERIAFFDSWLSQRLDYLERNVLGWARKYGVRLVIDVHGSCGGRGANGEVNMYHTPAYADHFVATWRSIARRFAGNADIIYGYDIFNEPVMHLTPAPGCDYWTLQKRCAEAIRQCDRETPVIVESDNWDGADGFARLPPLAMENIIYQVHCYNPHDYTHQFVNGSNKIPLSYPFTRASGERIDKAWLRKVVQPVVDFQRRHNAKIYVGEFAAICWAKGAERYIRDQIEIFEELGWDWTYHAFREWQGWSVEHEPVGEPGTCKFRPSADNPRRRVLFEALRGK